MIVHRGECPSSVIVSGDVRGMQMWAWGCYYWWHSPVACTCGSMEYHQWSTHEHFHARHSHPFAPCWCHPWQAHALLLVVQPPATPIHAWLLVDTGTLILTSSHHHIYPRHYHYYIPQAGNTALILASYNGHLGVVLVLVAAGADVNIKDKMVSSAWLAK